MQSAPASSGKDSAIFPLLLGVSLAHLVNDIGQSLLPAIYPVFEETYKLSYAQVGLITLTFQCTASILQPVVGLLTDRKPRPYALPMGMTLSLGGLLFLSMAHSYPAILLAAAAIGLGSAIFHPEASRIAQMAAGRHHGLAQSIFQVGGNAGSSIGPLLAIFVTTHGQGVIAWFSLIALVGVLVLAQVSRWMTRNLHRIQKRPSGVTAQNQPSKTRVATSIGILITLIFSKYIYLTSMITFFTFFTMTRFGVGKEQSQVYLFIFLFAVALGTIIGGPVGDRIGRKRVIWASILGVAPFTIALPHANLGMTLALAVIIGVVLASAFSAILVYATELMPGRVGVIAGLFFGLAFGIAGIGSALLGVVADHWGILFVFQICSFLPLLGLLTIFLPNIERPQAIPSH